MNNFEIEINGKKYRLKFGYGCLRILSEHYGIGLQELFDKFGNLGKKEIEFAVDFVWAAVTASGDTVDKDDIGDTLLLDPEKISGVLEHFMASLPQNKEAEGKQDPATAPETQSL